MLMEAVLAWRREACGVGHVLLLSGHWVIQETEAMLGYRLLDKHSTKIKIDHTADEELWYSPATVFENGAIGAANVCEHSAMMRTWCCTWHLG